MKKKIIVSVLTFVMLLSSLFVCSTDGMANDDLPKTKVTKAVGYSEKDYCGIKYTWKKVAGATGYEYRYNAFWTDKSTSKDYSKIKKTKKTTAKIGFQDCEIVKFQVRAYRIAEGDETYKDHGKWYTYTLTQKQAEALLNQ